MTPEPNKVDPVIPAGQGASPEAVVAPGSGTESPGASLRALREARGWSIADVCARLKFAPRQIEALEAGRWELLPQGPSLRGLVRNYARLLEVSPETFVQALPAHLQAQPAPLARVGGAGPAVAELPPGSTLPGVTGSSRGGGLGWVLVIVLLLAVVGLAAYLFFAWWLPRTQGLEATPEVPMPFAIEVPGGQSASVSGSVITASPVPEVSLPVGAGVPETDSGPEAGMLPQAATEESATTAAAPAAEAPGGTSPLLAEPVAAASPTGPFVVPGLSPEAVPPAPEPAPTPQVVVPPNQVRFQVQDASWVEVRDADGNVVLSATLQPGDIREVEVAPPARVVIGNAQGVALGWQGQAVDLAQHQRGNVARLTLE